MSQVNYKSTRLLVEAINKAMDAVRKAAMGNIPLPWDHLNELRDLVAQLTKRADRTALEDVPEMEPADYVATMKPLVAAYHRQLADRSMIPACLCMDLRASACVVILVGDQGSLVQAAHDPGRPDAALVVETLLASLDGGAKQVAADAAGVTAEVVAQVTGGAWEVYRCDRADPDRACGIRRVGPPDPYERDFVVHDTNREECQHGMQLADAESIVGAHNLLVAAEVAAEPEMGDEDGWG